LNVPVARIALLLFSDLSLFRFVLDGAEKTTLKRFDPLVKVAYRFATTVVGPPAGKLALTLD
jgi:hypothetical protein